MQIELPHGRRPCTPGALWNHLINLLGRSSRAVEVEVLVIPGAMRLHWCFIGASILFAVLCLNFIPIRLASTAGHADTKDKRSGDHGAQRWPIADKSTRRGLSSSLRLFIIH